MLEIVYLPISELKPYGKNARKHAKRDIYAIQTSIERFGMNDPIGIWGNKNIIVEGHGRLEACKHLGMREVPCVRLDHLTDEQRREYAIAHNATAELSEWDFDVLNEEITGLDFSGFDFDFMPAQKIKSSGEFLQEMQDNDFERGKEYEAFENKFKHKLTTDDCFTPPIVYDAVADYVAEKYNLKKENFVRPFKPNGDYQNENYKSTDIVVDNPPFSQMAEILRFYNENGIKYFLFAPHLTIFAGKCKNYSAIVCGVGVTYENGAVVSTSFVTNLENCMFRSAPNLYKRLDEANRANAAKNKTEVTKYKYPKFVVIVSQVADFSKYGIEFEVGKNDCCFVASLDMQKEYGKAIYGGGFLISNTQEVERKKAEQEVERKKVERKKAERKEAEQEVLVLELSERELEIIKGLDNDG